MEPNTITEEMKSMDDRRRAKEKIKRKMKEHNISPEELKESTPAPRKPSREAREPDLQRRRRQGRGMITRGSLLGHEPVLGKGPRPVTQGSVLGNGKEISDRIWGRRR